MRWSLPIARVAGTLVQVHVTFFLLLAWIGGAYYLQGGLAAALAGTAFILLVFGCVLLHEFGHALAARRYGIPTPTITLLPIGGVARLQRMPENPREELVVAAAGPLVNVGIAGVLFVALAGEVDLGALTHLEEQQFGLWNKLFGINVFLVLFNLIPAFPMDGGRMLRAFLAFRLPYPRATRIAATIGQGLAFVFGLVGLFGNPLLLLIALFVFMGAGQEAALVEMRESIRGLSVDEAMRPATEPFVGDEEILEVARKLIERGQPAAAVVDEDGGLRGLAAREDVFAAIQQGRRSDALSSVLRTDLPSVSRRGLLREAVELMQSSGASVLPVVDVDGRYVGTVSGESIGQMLMLRADQEKSTA